MQWTCKPSDLKGQRIGIKLANETTTSCQLVQNVIVCAVATFKTLLFVQSRHSKLYCLCSLDIQNFIVCAVATFKTLLFVQSRHSKLYCLCSRDIQNFIVCAVATFKTLLFVQSRHSKLYCLCSRDIRNFIVCAIATFKTLLFVQSQHSKLYCLCSRAIRNFLVCVSLLGLRRLRQGLSKKIALSREYATKLNSVLSRNLLESQERNTKTWNS